MTSHLRRTRLRKIKLGCSFSYPIIYPNPKNSIPSSHQQHTKVEKFDIRNNVQNCRASREVAKRKHTSREHKTLMNASDPHCEHLNIAIKALANSKQEVLEKKRTTNPDKISHEPQYQSHSCLAQTRIKINHKILIVN